MNPKMILVSDIEVGDTIVWAGNYGGKPDLRTYTCAAEPEEYESEDERTGYRFCGSIQSEAAGTLSYPGDWFWMPKDKKVMLLHRP